MNTRPSTPLCQNCLSSELSCRVTREYDRQPCCSQCEHVALDVISPRADGTRAEGSKI